MNNQQIGYALMLILSILLLCHKVGQITIAIRGLQP